MKRAPLLPSLRSRPIRRCCFGGNSQLCAQTQQSTQQPWQQIPIPKLPEFHPAQPKRIELPNGMVIFLQEDHELADH